ncbi:MAG: TldD/PmbA family protein [Nanoarchaeota archaeon]
MILPKKVLMECKKLGAEDAVVSLERLSTSQVKFSNSKIITTENNDNIGLSIFLSLKKRVVVTTLRELSVTSALKSVKELISFAKTLPENKDYNGIAEGPFKYRKKSKYSIGIDEAGTKGIMQVSEAIKKAKNLGIPKTAGVWEANYATSELHTSGNVAASEEGYSFYFSLRAFTDKNASGHSVCSSTKLEDLHVDKSVDEASGIAKLYTNPVKIMPGKYNVLFYPLAAANLIDNAAQSASIFSVESGMSFWANKLGKKVANNNFTLYDDATDDTGVGSCRFDAEGVPTKKVEIIGNGLLKTYLHNTSTAKKYGTKTTANAGLVSPEPRNLVVEGGNVNKENIISQMDKGLVVTNLWYTRFQNNATGEFSTVPRDGLFLVKKGKLFPVRDARISDNLANMLMQVEKACNDQRWIVSWEVSVPTKTPSLLINNVRVSRSVD